MKIIFIRHGESEANTNHIISNTGYKHGLTETGRNQVGILAEKLKDKYSSPVRIISSPLKRADETAGIIGRYFQMEHSIDKRLIEFHAGYLEDKSDKESWSQFSKLWKQWLAGESAAKGIPGGESLTDVVERLEDFLKDLINDHNENDTIFCVSHGGLLIMGLPNALNIRNIQGLKSQFLQNTGVIEIELINGDELICNKYGPL